MPAQAAMAPVVRLSGVRLRYGKAEALAGIDQDLPAGCMVGLIGPDGVGKSSLLSLIAGARQVQDGTVDVLGGDMRERRRSATAGSTCRRRPARSGRPCSRPADPGRSRPAPRPCR